MSSSWPHYITKSCMHSSDQNVSIEFVFLGVLNSWICHFQILMSWNGLAHAHNIGVCHLAWPDNGLMETFPYVMGRGLTIPWYITWTMWLLDMEVFCAGGVDDNGTKHNLLSLITNFEYQLANPHFWVFTLNFAIQQMTKIARCKFLAITCD